MPETRSVNPLSEDAEILARQYREHMYPVPTSDIEQDYLRPGHRLMGDPISSFNELWPEGRKTPVKRVLVAGCGSQQAAILAASNPDIEVLGIDLSETSIGYSDYLRHKHNIRNLELRQGDFRVATETEFDLIHCTGVIHHLDDPSHALNILGSKLAPQGVIYLAVYAKYARLALEPLKEALGRLGAGPTKEGAVFTRKLIGGLHKHHPVKIFEAAFEDISHDNEIIDLLLHPKECYYNVPEFLSLAAENDLMLKNWCWPERYSLLFYTPEMVMAGKADHLSTTELWATTEALDHSPQMHHAYFCKRDESLPLVHTPAWPDANSHYRFPRTARVSVVDDQFSWEQRGKRMHFKTPLIKEFAEKNGGLLRETALFKAAPHLVRQLALSGVIQLSLVPFQK